jgi:Contractile injection system tube protein
MFLKPPKLVLTNLTTDDRLFAQFNPEEFEIAAKAVYQKHAIPGSHQVLQYSHSENLGMQFDLRFQVRGGNANTAPFSTRDRKHAEGFLLALTAPGSGRAQVFRTVTTTAPPRVLVEWPFFLAFEAAVEDVTFRYTRFDGRRAAPIELTASVSVTEMRDLRFTSADAKGRVFDRYGANRGRFYGAGDD